MTATDMMLGDAKKKKKLLIAFVALFTVFALFRILLMPRIHDWLMGMEKARAFSLVTRTMAACLLLMVPVGLYLFRLAGKVLREGRFPPSDSTVIRDTPIRRGKHAKAMALLFIVVGLALIVLSLLAAVLVLFFIPDAMSRT